MSDPSQSSEPFVPFAPPAANSSASPQTSPPAPASTVSASRGESAAGAGMPVGHQLGVPPQPDADASRSFERFEGAHPGHQLTPSGGTDAAEPIVTLQRDGEKLTGIRIECSCGQIIELACNYGNVLAP